jgi:anti-anti-sigma factor
MFQIKFLKNLEIYSLIKNRQLLDEALSQIDNEVELDFEKVNFVDSSGIDLLVNFYKRLQEKGKKAYFKNVKHDITEIFDLMNLTNFFFLKKD